MWPFKKKIEPEIVEEPKPEPRDFVVKIVKSIEAIEGWELLEPPDNSTKLLYFNACKLKIFFPFRYNFTWLEVEVEEEIVKLKKHEKEAIHIATFDLLKFWSEVEQQERQLKILDCMEL